MKNNLEKLKPLLHSVVAADLNQSSSHFSIPEFPMGKSIPKIIHQTFYSTSLPDELTLNIGELKRLNPDWEYCFWDDSAIEKFIGDNYPISVLTSFNKIDSTYGAARADLFRYLLMYKCGGVYLDIKSCTDKPLNEVLKPDDRYLLSYWQNREGEEFQGWGKHPELGSFNRGEFQQWYIACAPGHPYLKSVIESVLRNISVYNPVYHGVGRHGVLRVTGPIAYTLAINKLLSTELHRLVENHLELGFKYSVYSNNTHRQIFRSHYTNLKISVVHLRGARRKIVRVLQLIQKVKNFFSDRLVHL